MGYYTKYKLEYSYPDGSFGECDEYDDILEEISSISNYNNPFNDEEIKWYEHDTHMRQLSKNHPLKLFKLYGKGEESGDIWIKYFKNGKMQCTRGVVQVTYEEFDPNKLT